MQIMMRVQERKILMFLMSYKRFFDLDFHSIASTSTFFETI